MIKDMVVNLVGRGPQDFAADYALSVAATFGAHLVGTAFVYDAVIPDGALGAIPVDLIELQQEENSKAANTAVERFNARATRQVCRLKHALSTPLWAGQQRCLPGLRGGSISLWSGKRSASMARPKIS